MRVVVVEELGGPAQLRIARRPTPDPGPGEIRVKISAAGVNFMDTGARRLGAAHGRLPFVPGVEGAGRITAVGDGVTDVALGDRVAWVYAYGSYAEQIALPASSAVPVPDDISDETAAGLMMQGITAHHFVTEAADIQPGQLTVVHAAAGGLGRKLTQLVKARQGTVIAIVSTEQKAFAARQAGADHTLVSTGDAFVEQVKDLTDGKGVHVVFDGGGDSTFRASMNVLRPHGLLLYYGTLIGAVPTLSMAELPRSIKVCCPVFRDHIPTREALLRHSNDLFDLVRRGILDPGISRRYPLDEAARAHHDLESRKTSGKLLLLP